MFEIEIANRVKIRKGKPQTNPTTQTHLSQPFPSPAWAQHAGPASSPAPPARPSSQPATQFFPRGPTQRQRVAQPRPAPPRPTSRRSPRRSLSLTAPRARLPASSPPRRARANGQPQRPPEIPGTFPADPHAEDPRAVAFLNRPVTPLHPIHPTRRPANPSRRLPLLHQSRARYAAVATPSRCIPGPATPHHSFISGPGNSPRPPLPTPWPVRTGILPETSPQVSSVATAISRRRRVTLRPDPQFASTARPRTESRSPGTRRDATAPGPLAPPRLRRRSSPPAPLCHATDLFQAR